MSITGTRKYLLLLFCILRCNDMAGRHASDSIALKYLPDIVSATSDTGRSLALLRYAEALYPYEQDSAWSVGYTAYRQCHAVNFYKGIATAWVLFGNWEYKKGNLNRSDSFYTLVINNPHIPMPYPTIAHAGIAQCFLMQGLHEEALDHYFSAIHMLEKSSDTAFQSAYIYNHLGTIWSQLGNMENAFLYQEKALEISIRTKDSFQLGNTLNRKGNYYIVVKSDTAEALMWYEKALQVSRACKDITTQLVAVCNMSLFSKGDTTLRKHAYDDLLNNKEIDDYQRLNLQSPIAVNLYLLGEYNKAEAIWKSTIEEATRLHARIYRLDPYEGLCSLAVKRKEFHKAYYYLKLHAALNDTLLNEEKIKAVGLLDERFKKAKRDRLLSAQKLIQIRSTNAIADKNRILILLAFIAAFIAILAVNIQKNIRRKNALLKAEVQLKRKEERLRKLKAAMEGKENERKRIARELHDGVGSLLSVAKMNVSMLHGKLPSSQNGENIHSAIHLLDTTAKNIRIISHNLIPDILLKGGIEEALQLFCQYTSSSNNISVGFQAYGDGSEIEPEMEKVIFIILQDIVMHILQNHNLTTIDIQLNWLHPSLFVTIETNGILPKHGTGITESDDEWELIEERMRNTGGSMEMHTDGNLGTTIDMEFDLVNEKASI